MTIKERLCSIEFYNPQMSRIFVFHIVLLHTIPFLFCFNFITIIAIDTNCRRDVTIRISTTVSMATEYQSGDESHGFDIPLPSQAINLPRVAANVVDIQDSKCEGRVNVTGEGSVSKRTMRYPSGRLGLPRDEGKAPGIARDRPGSSPCEPQRITERVTVRTFARRCSTTDRAVVPDIRTYVQQKKKEEALASAAANSPPLSTHPQDGTRLISRC